ncbi:MAG: hypothetical protein JWL59_3408 [Chthoniobacteraceae bacterium]|nr:hypothetical protein [Chthoniobacteraceae bacterium]
MKLTAFIVSLSLHLAYTSLAQVPGAPTQLPELDALRVPYQKNLAATQAYRETKMAPVTSAYAAALEKLEKDATTRGEIVNAGRIKTERDRLESKNELTAAERDQMPPPLRAVYDKYQNDAKPIVTMVQQEERKQTRQYLTSLESLQRHFTAQKEVAKAAIVDTERAAIPPALLGVSAPAPDKKTVATSTVIVNGKLDPVLADKIAEVVKNGSVKITESSGKPGGNRDVPETGALLVGFEFQEMKYAKGLYMRSLRPYFMTREKIVAGIDRGKVETVSEKVMARSGYAVAGLLTVAGGKGVRVIFMKIDPVTGHFDTAPNSTYMSKWIGTKNRDTPIQIGGDGHFIIGVYGLTGADADTIGLVEMP